MVIHVAVATVKVAATGYFDDVLIDIHMDTKMYSQLDYIRCLAVNKSV